MMFLISTLITSVMALTVIVEHPQKGILYEQDIAIETPTNVGAVSLQTFELLGTVYDGSELGFSSIDGIEQKLDIISNSEMKAYGWCFSIDGVVPETLTHETRVTSEQKVLRWFYAFAHYKDGQWISQCEEDSAK